MKRLPIIYTHIYCLIRKRVGNRTGEIYISNREFRVLLSHIVLGSDKELSKIILDDLVKYGYVKHNSKDRIVLNKIHSSISLFEGVQEFKDLGLL